MDISSQVGICWHLQAFHAMVCPTSMLALRAGSRSQLATTVAVLILSFSCFFLSKPPADVAPWVSKLPYELSCQCMPTVHSIHHCSQWLHPWQFEWSPAFSIALWHRTLVHYESFCLLHCIHERPCFGNLCYLSCSLGVNSSRYSVSSACLSLACQAVGDFIPRDTSLSVNSLCHAHNAIGPESPRMLIDYSSQLPSWPGGPGT